LGGELLKAKYTFTGYAEDLPSAGFTGCYAGEYARKHVPWVHFTDVPSSENRPFADFPTYDRLPTVSFVVPNLLNDMHSASIARGDAWLREHIAPLVDWAMTHKTLVIITWDEDYGTVENRIPTLLLGQMVKPGRYDARITHYNVLRTLETFYNLPDMGASANEPAIENVWRTGP
jgi:acid phosphatase